MVVMTQTPRVLELRRSVMEWHLVNHPLDCPVCDQAGECWLQIYYMQHGLYEPRMIDDKVHKPKAVPIGPHVMLDAERCILCSRCVRFCDTVTKTGELGIFNRGDHSELGLFPGTTLDNAYSGNVVDICPVGRAHRPRLPLPGARLVPRPREVGLPGLRPRLQHRGPHEHEARPPRPGPAGRPAEAPVQRRREPVVDVRRGPLRLRRRRRARPGSSGPSSARAGRRAPSRGTRPWRRRPRASAPRAPRAPACSSRPRMSNEDLWLARRLFVDTLGAAHADFRVPPRAPGSQDDLLRVADKTPNTPRRRGARLRPGRARRRAARPRGRPGGPAPAPLDLRPRPPRVGLARGGGRGGARAGRGRGLPGAERQRGRARGPTWSCRARPTWSARAPGRT